MHMSGKDEDTTLICSKTSIIRPHSALSKVVSCPLHYPKSSHVLCIIQTRLMSSALSKLVSCPPTFGEPIWVNSKHTFLYCTIIRTNYASPIWFGYSRFNCVVWRGFGMSLYRAIFPILRVKLWKPNMTIQGDLSWLLLVEEIFLCLPNL